MASQWTPLLGEGSQVAVLAEPVHPHRVRVCAPAVPGEWVEGFLVGQASLLPDYRHSPHMT